MLCAQQGIQFVPMVIEAHAGGWSKTARRVLDAVAKSLSTSWNRDEEVAGLAIAQRLSTTLDRETRGRCCGAFRTVDSS